LFFFPGKPIDSYEFKVVDDNRDIVPIGTQGVLCVRCPFRFVTYLDMEELFLEAVDKHNWFHTGDMAHFRQDGNFVVDGRKKEMISIGTNKFFPWSIEKVLKNLTGAENAFAVGVPNTRLGQVVCACVLPKKGISLSESDIKKFCDEMFLEKSTAFGVSVKPMYYIIIDKVPLTATGKIDRRTFGLQAKEKLGL
jgi:fatty-acyl-CoA synthase